MTHAPQSAAETAFQSPFRKWFRYRWLPRKKAYLGSVASFLRSTSLLCVPLLLIQRILILNELCLDQSSRPAPNR